MKQEHESQQEEQKLVIEQLQKQIDDQEDSDEVNRLKEQLEERDGTIEELTLEKNELEENYAKELEEITETGYNEISELEEKLDAEQERASILEAEIETLKNGE